MGTPFFEHCKLSLSWTTSTPTVRGKFYKNNLNNDDPYETDLQLLENPRITNINVIKLHPQTTTLIGINIKPSNLNYDDMTLSINNTESDEYLCTKLNTKIKGNNLAMGNVWENKLVKPTVVNNKEIHMQAHITNRSDNIIELPKSTMHIQKEMKPTFNKVLINTNFLVTSIATITQDNFRDTKEPTYPLNMDQLPTPPNYADACYQN